MSDFIISHVAFHHFTLSGTNKTNAHGINLQYCGLFTLERVVYLPFFIYLHILFSKPLSLYPRTPSLSLLCPLRCAIFAVPSSLCHLRCALFAVPLCCALSSPLCSIRCTLSSLCPLRRVLFAVLTPFAILCLICVS